MVVNTTQLTSSVTRSPAGLRPTLSTEEKSTFIIIGVIMSQISTAIGTLVRLFVIAYQRA